MLHFIHAKDLSRQPGLEDSMFRDRACQFKARLDWDVSVDDQGHERDAYDDLNPLYVIWSGPDGRHQGSMRFMPTTGRTMINDHFTHLIGEGTLQSPRIWECTRFCLAKGAPSPVAAALMLAGGEVMRQRGVDHFVGVFDARMVRIYRRIGWSPEVLGSAGTGRDEISVGLWSRATEDRARIALRAGLAPQQAETWYHSCAVAPAVTTRPDFCAVA
ncbi:MAG: acyl-homoserine-lactone synthase [Pseudomonadota bacterium]